jgi:ParB-like chromosome segregation protein Spo0J
MSPHTASKSLPQASFDWRQHLAVHPAAELFPEMDEAQLRELAADIKRNGLREPPVLYDGPERPCILDGRNRLNALELIGRQIFDANGNPGRIFSHQSARQSFDPYAYVVSKNLCRRHLTAEDRRNVITKLLKAKPEWSNRRIAAELKVDHHKVAEVRRSGEATGEVPPVDKTTGKDGRVRPARNSKSVNPKKATKPKPGQATIAAAASTDFDTPKDTVEAIEAEKEPNNNAPGDALKHMVSEDAAAASAASATPRIPPPMCHRPTRRAGRASLSTT